MCSILKKDARVSARHELVRLKRASTNTDRKPPIGALCRWPTRSGSVQRAFGAGVSVRAKEGTSGTRVVQVASSSDAGTDASASAVVVVALVISKRGAGS